MLDLVQARSIPRDELLDVARRASDSDPTADLETGLVSSVIRRLVMMRGTIQRTRLLAEATDLVSPLLATAPLAMDAISIAEAELDALLSLGDLVSRQPAPRARVLVEPATPSFVRLVDYQREFIVLGGSYDGRPMVPARLLERVEVRGRVRWLTLRNDESEDELVHELEWRGLRELDRTTWARSPAPTSAEAVISVFAEQTIPCAEAALREFEFFDPTSPASYFRGRIHAPDVPHLRSLLREQRWLAARATDALGLMNYYLLTDIDGEQIGSCRINRQGVEARDNWLRVAAALAQLAAVGEGHRFRAAINGNELFLYFPPPSWLERMLLLGRPRPRTRGALRVDAFEGDVLREVAKALKAVLFAEVERS
jgi:hypothetical protein